MFLLILLISVCTHKITKIKILKNIKTYKNVKYKIQKSREVLARRERDELIPPSYLSFFHYTILFLLCYTYSQQMKIKVLYVPVTFIVLVYAAFSVYHIIQESNLLENERIRLRVCINIKQLYFQSIYLIYYIFILLFLFWFTLDMLPSSFNFIILLKHQ